MTRQPETDRQYAHFVLVGMDDTSAIDDLLKLKAVQRWNAGDEYQKRGNTLSRRSSHWKLESGLDDTRPLVDHIAALLDLLASRRVALLELGTSFDLKIVCVSYAYQSFGLELPFELQRLATTLGVRFSFAAYSYGDIHEEISELRTHLKGPP